MALEGGGQRTSATLTRAITAQYRGRIRWYPVHYHLVRLDPAPRIAADVEARTFAIGGALLRAASFTNCDAMPLWDLARVDRADVGVEIITKSGVPHSSRN